MFTFIKIDVLSSSYGPSFSGIVLTGAEASAEPYRQGQAVPLDLPVPWRELQANPDVFSLLQWRTAISEFAGRDAEMEALKAWAYSDLPISAKFMTGEGGVGKTRLAAELAMELREDGWAAGFPDLRHDSAYFAAKSGTLLIVDYPEELPGGLESLFTGLARVEESGASRLRVLFLSRREPDVWRQLALDTNADAMIDWAAVPLGPLVGEAAWSVFHSALERAAEAEDTVPPPVSMEVLDAWLEHAPENDRALFIVAAALYCALHPDSPLVDYKGRDVVTALVEREIVRLRGTAKGAGLGSHALSQLLAFAAIRDGLDSEAANALAAKDELHLQLPEWPSLVDHLRPTSWLADDEVPAPAPDILAAALIVEVFRSDPNNAPEWLWAAIDDDVPGGLERLGRLSYDAEVVLGLHAHRISHWLVLACEGRPVRCRDAEPVLTDVTLPLGLRPLGVVVWHTLADVAENDEEKARILVNLSNARASVGDAVGALEAIREAVEIRRRLTAASPARYAPDLAGSLNNLSSDLREVGDAAGALEAIREAVEIRRRLAAASPARYEPDLAMSQSNLSVVLSGAGDTVAALDAIREAVEIYRRLAAASPARYEAYLASSLNTLSNRLNTAGDSAGALEAVREAVELRRRLAAASPARYEPDLAQSLNNLSNRLNTAGDAAGELDAIGEAVAIHRRLAAASPARYEPDLATSLNNLSIRLNMVGDPAGALEAIRESEAICRRLAAASPARYEPDLAASLNNLSNRLSAVDDTSGALEASREAVEIYRRVAAARPARYAPDLARSLGVLGRHLREAREIPEAKEAFREGAKLVRPHAEEFPEGPAARLLANLESDLRQLEGPGES